MAAKPAPKLAPKADSNITNAELAAYMAEVVKLSDDRLIESIRAIVREELKASDAAHADAISCQTVMLTTEISTAIANTASLSGQRPGRAKSAPKNSGVPTNDLSMFRALMDEKGDFYNTIIEAPALKENHENLIKEGATSKLVIPAWNMLNSKDGLTVIVDDEETVWKTDVVTKIRNERLQAAAGATDEAAAAAPEAEADAADADADADATDADAVEEEVPKPKKAAPKKAAARAAKPVAAKAAKPAAPKAAAPKAARAKK